MKILRKLLAPALALGSVFGGAALAQEKSAPLPDAPTPVANLQLRSPLLQPFSYKDTHPAFEYKVVAPPSASSSPLGDGFIGKMAGYVDRHSNQSETPFDFAMGYNVKDRFTLMAGTVVDMRTHSGQYEAVRQSLRVTTGLPDWETQNLRNIMAPTPVNTNLRGGDGFAVGIKIRLGGRKP